MTEPIPLHTPTASRKIRTRRCAQNRLRSLSGSRARGRICACSFRPRSRAARRWTIRCSSGRRGWARPRWRRSWRKELGVGFRATSGPVIAKAGDLAALLTNLEPHDVLFIDEIHRLNPVVEEVLYPAMEDRALDLIIGEGPVGAQCADRSAALHADRRDHAAGPADHASARPVRHSGPPELLHRGRAGAGRYARRGADEPRHRARRRTRNCAPCAGNAAGCRPPAAPGARLRRGGEVRNGHRRTSRTRR